MALETERTETQRLTKLCNDADDDLEKMQEEIRRLKKDLAMTNTLHQSCNAEIASLKAALENSKLLMETLKSKTLYLYILH